MKLTLLVEGIFPYKVRATPLKGGSSHTIGTNKLLQVCREIIVEIIETVNFRFNPTEEGGISDVLSEGKAH